VPDAPDPEVATDGSGLGWVDDVLAGDQRRCGTAPETRKCSLCCTQKR
jgi:hypothetical protein